MAMRARGRPGYPPRQPTRPTDENFKPKSEWKYEDDATRLLVYLPGFVKEQIRVMFTYVDNITLAIKVQGQRHLADGRRSQFFETYEIPENCDANKISSNFERGCLRIVMPKIVDAKKVYADKEESIATPDISSGTGTGTLEKAETSAMEKQEKEKDVEAVSPKKEKSQNGREETSSKTTALADTAEKIDEKRVGSASESASESDSAERIDGNKRGPGGETDSGKSDGKPQEGQGEASQKTASLVDSTEKMDRKMVGSGSESASEKGDGKSANGQDDASTKTVALFDTMGSGDEIETIQKEIPVEAEKPERSAEETEEFSSALEAVGPNTEEKEKIIDEYDKSVNEERKKESIVGKSKDIKDDSASAASSEVSTEGQHLLNMGAAVLVIMGIGVYISYSVVPKFFNF